MIETLSKDQIDEARHALGLTYKKKPTRNYFYTNANDKNWRDLVEKGLATTSAGWNEGKAYFRLTFEAAKMLYGKPMSLKYFKELP